MSCREPIFMWYCASTSKIPSSSVNLSSRCENVANDCTWSEDPFPRRWVHRPSTLPLVNDDVPSVRTTAEVGPSSVLQRPFPSPVLTLPSTVKSSLLRDQPTRRPFVSTLQLSSACVRSAHTVSSRLVHCE